MSRDESGEARRGTSERRPTAMKTINVKTSAKVQMVDVTAKIQKVISDAGLKNGHCLAFVSHTTAGVTINENADPNVIRDMILALEKAVPDNLSYRHAEGNSPAHVKSSLVGASLCLPVENGSLVLGTWQSVFFCEFDGPRSRRMQVSLMGK